MQLPKWVTSEHRQRFLGRIALGDDCWEWRGPLNYKGYGICNVRGSHTAHRASWMIFKGDIPAGLCVLHRCDNRACVRPDHLFLGTVKDNNLDRHAKGRTWVPTTRRITPEALEYIRSSDETNQEIAAKLGFAAGSISRFRKALGTSRTSGYRGQARVMRGGRGGRKPEYHMEVPK